MGLLEKTQQKKAKSDKRDEQANLEASARRPASDKAVHSAESPERTQQALIKPLRPAQPKTFPIVGIGASAGGLEAFTELLQNLPTDTGMGFVLVQHLDPTHESILTKLLAKATSMPVSEVKNKLLVKPNHVYVIPPDTTMTIQHGMLKLVPEKRASHPHRSIDHFLASLAKDRGPQAIGVVLSGAASDGTMGLETIKHEGGITFAQDDQSAKYNSMPRSAVASGCVDYVLPPGRIAQELAKISQHAWAQASEAVATASEPPKSETNYKKVLSLLRSRTGVDFTYYKSSTINRRIARRMVLHKVPRLSAYVTYLRHHPAEVEALYQDVLISVTSFFRNPEVFEALKDKFLPKIVRNRNPDQPVRVWVLGCSTGQEAYSLAMIFLEFVSHSGLQIPLQIFATDLNETLLEKARQGLYTKAQVQELSPERLRRFFVAEEGGFRICKPVREMCVFARHDVLSDPPFSKMDILSCRNLMIYLEPVLQKRLIPALHYALKPGGLLLLGSSENISGFSDLFAVEDKAHKFYIKKPNLSLRQAPLPVTPLPEAKAPVGQKPRLLGLGLANEVDLQKEADRVALANYTPAGVLLNEALHILQFRGDTSPYLAHMPGRASFDLLKMLREGLLLPVRIALQKAKKQNEIVRVENVGFHFDGQTRRVQVEIIPLQNVKERGFLVSFVPVSGRSVASHEAEPVHLRPQIPPDLVEAAGEIARLRSELTAAREYLQSVTEQYEAANEELQAANEEMQSGNEELQSINEELETTKEELESTNEELTTVNEEMNSRNVELHQLNNDLNNVLSGVTMCIVVLSSDLCIRRFTPLAEKLLNLVPTDVGRPITNIRPNIKFPNLERALLEVIGTAQPKTQEVQDNAGKWYSLRLFPYKTLNRKIEGALLVLVDIDALKRSEQQIRAARDYAESIVETVREPLIILDEQLQVERANHSFFKTFQLSPEATVGRRIYEIGEGEWNIPPLRTLLQEVLPKNSAFADFEVEKDFSAIGRRTMLLNGRAIPGAEGRPHRILLAIEDFTDRKKLEDKLRQTVAELEAFAYSVSHDLRAPLRAMLGFANLVLEESPEQLSPATRDYLQRIAAGARHLEQLIQDVLAYSRVARTEVRLRPLDLERLIEYIIQSYPGFQPPKVQVQIQPPLLQVLAHEASLTQCISNLFSNAVKFIAPGTTPRIKIWTEARENQVRIWFEDNGIGIESANLARIFAIFERVHSVYEYEGTGIGLAIVRKAVERMGGTLGVESEMGKGSKFWIQLKGAGKYE